MGVGGLCAGPFTPEERTKACWVAPKAALMILEKRKFPSPVGGGVELPEFQQQSVRHRLKGALTHLLDISFV
jgi:hypothetical protein